MVPLDCGTSGTCPGKGQGQPRDVHREGMSVDASYFRVCVTTGFGMSPSALPSVWGGEKGTRQRSGDKALDRSTKGGIQEHRSLMGRATWDPELRRALPTVAVPSLPPCVPSPLADAKDSHVVEAVPACRADCARHSYVDH